MPGIEEALYWLVLSSQGVWCKWQGLLLYTRLLCAKLNGPLMFPSLCPLVRHLRGPLSGFCLFLLSSFICCLKSSSGSLLLSTDVQWSASAIEVGKIDLIRLEEATGRKWHLREKVISESTSKGCLVGQFCPKCAGEPVRVLKGHDLCAYEASSSDCSWKIGLGRVRIKAGKKQMKWYHIGMVVVKEQAGGQCRDWKRACSKHVLQVNGEDAVACWMLGTGWGGKEH